MPASVKQFFFPCRLNHFGKVIDDGCHFPAVCAHRRVVKRVAVVVVASVQHAHALQSH
jgi:hypothetical protein